MRRLLYAVNAFTTSGEGDPAAAMQDVPRSPSRVGITSRTAEQSTRHSP